MRLLIVEDDARIADAAATYLRRAGFAVDVADTGEDSLRLANEHEYDLVILDVALPGIDGFEVCRRLRVTEHPVRIMMATARDAVPDRIAGLNIGADDYLLKPFALEELLARARALLRRPAAAVPIVLRVGELALDTGTRNAERNGREIPLTNKEFAVLEYLMMHAGRVVTREKLSAHAWDENYDPASNVVDVYVARVRRKIDDVAEAPLLATVRGAGYRLGESTRRSAL